MRCGLLPLQLVGVERRLILQEDAYKSSFGVQDVSGMLRGEWAQSQIGFIKSALLTCDPKSITFYQAYAFARLAGVIMQSIMLMVLFDCIQTSAFTPVSPPVISVVLTWGPPAQRFVIEWLTPVYNTSALIVPT